MKKIFEIEWADDYGPEWMNTSNLESCLFSETHCSGVQIKVKELRRNKDEETRLNCAFLDEACVDCEEDCISSGKNTKR